MVAGADVAADCSSCRRPRCCFAGSILYRIEPANARPCTCDVWLDAWLNRWPQQIRGGGSATWGAGSKHTVPAGAEMRCCGPLRSCLTWRWTLKGKIKSPANHPGEVVGDLSERILGRHSQKWGDSADSTALLRHSILAQVNHRPEKPRLVNRMATAVAVDLCAVLLQEPVSAKRRPWCHLAGRPGRHYFVAGWG